MITGYFGVPGCGKSSLLTLIAIKEMKKMSKGKSKYKHIVSNFPIKGVDLIETADLAKFLFTDTLILLDELTLDCDGRNFKSFDTNLKEFFILHRHCGCNIVYAVQDPSSVDKRIRDLTFDLHYISRTNLPFFKNFCTTRRIFRNLNINEFSSEMSLGYRFSTFLEALFGSANHRYYLPRAWRFYDSFDLSTLQSRPDFFKKEKEKNNDSFFISK